MFNQRNPKKNNSKVRFQHKQFTGKLHSARQYKRQSTAISETSWGRFFSLIGLPSLRAQIFTGFLFLLVVYLIYIPNILSLKYIAITGLSDIQTIDFEVAIRKEMKQSSIFYAQNNLVFFNEKILAQALNKVPSVAGYAQVKKDYLTQTLIISAESKYVKFLVSTPERVYDVYNDGLLKGSAGVGLAEWENLNNPALTKVKLFKNSPANELDIYFHKNLVNYLNPLLTEISFVPGFSINYIAFKEPVSTEPVLKELAEKEKTDDLPSNIIETEQNKNLDLDQQRPVVVKQWQMPINSSEVHIYLNKANFNNSVMRVVFDVSNEVSYSVGQLRLLLSQTTPERLEQLIYIDMRIPDKAFLCLVNTPCAK